MVFYTLHDQKKRINDFRRIIQNFGTIQWFFIENKTLWSMPTQFNIGLATDQVSCLLREILNETIFHYFGNDALERKSLKFS